ncbi:MAG: hypothetical protein AAFP86_02650, partial [Planctomycetota bacterium]
MHSTLENQSPCATHEVDADLLAHPRLHAVRLDDAADAFVLTIIAPNAIGVARTAVDLPGADIVTSRGGRSGS